MNKQAKIRSLNDAFRCGMVRNGQLLVTAGVAARGDDFVLRAMQAVASYDNFTPQNDLFGEHDFGGFQLDGEQLFFKIDYYDLDKKQHSPDPTDPDVTCRVLTVMLASEY